MAKKQIDLGLTGLDELFMDDKERVESQLPKIYEIPLSEIDEFPNHPFHVRLDEDMDQLVESIKERGIITPVTLRQKPDGRYEIVSGHRRTKACELAGLTTVKAEIKELSRDEAIILMVESNLQRTTILPSEKAFSYKMRLEAMNRQGQRTDLTSRPVVEKLDSAESVGTAQGDSGRQVQRYIRLTHLIEPLLDLVDSGKIAFRPAVELSYLTEGEQNSLLDSINSEQSSKGYAIAGVEFTYLKVADITTFQNQETTQVLYGFHKTDAANLLKAIGLENGADRCAEADSLDADRYFYPSDTLNKALAQSLEANSTTVKNALEAFIRNGCTAMAPTSEVGKTSAKDLPVGLYLLVETKVPEMVTSTTNPFFVSLPMTTVTGNDNSASLARS